MPRSALPFALIAGLFASPLAPYAVTGAFAAEVTSVAAGTTIYDGSGQKIGTVTDVLTSTRGVAYAVVDVGGYVGKPKTVLCPLSRINGTGNHMTVLMTREEMRSMPEFNYNVPNGSG